MNIINSYIKNNASFKTKYIYRFGVCGFYSDFNNMILNMLWCYQHQLQFRLSSRNCAAFGKEGWTKYFEPIVPESTLGFHERFNTREICIPENDNFLTLVKLRVWNLCVWGYQLFTNHYLMKDIFHNPRTTLYSKIHFNLPTLNVDGDLQDACRTMIDIVYRFNSDTSAHIRQLQDGLHLPDQYIGIHIRRGDKDIEWSPVDIEVYMNKAKQYSNLKDIFIFTDDYLVFESLEKQYPDFRFYTFVSKEERGYDNAQFSKVSKEKQDEQLLRMFASMEVLARSEHFIGTLNTNPGMFLGMRMNRDKVHYIDSESWEIM